MSQGTAAPQATPDPETETSPRRSRPTHDPYEAFRFKNFRLYSGGWMVFMVGHQITSVAVGFEMYERTGKALALGLVAGVQALPPLLLAIPAGQLADTLDRRKLILVSAGLAMLCALGLAACSFFQGPLWCMYGLLFLSSVVLVMGRPARASLLPLVVPREVFPNAATWNSTFFQAASVLGPAIGGLVVAFSLPLAYLLDAAGMLVYFITTLKLRLDRPVRANRPEGFQGLFEGVRFVRGNSLILATLSLDMFAVLLGGATYLLPIYAKDILNVGASGLGWLRAAPAAGALCMGLFLAHSPPMKKAGRSLLWAVAGFGVATVIFGVSKSFWLSFAMLFLTGALDNISVVIRHTLVQMLTPDAMRGRVSAINMVFISASNELGGVESGLTAAWWGTVPAVVVGGLGTLGVVCLTAMLAPSLRSFGSLRDAKPPED